MTAEEILKYSTMLKNDDWVVGIRMTKEYLERSQIGVLFQIFFEKYPNVDFSELYWNKKEGVVVNVLFSRDNDGDCPSDNIPMSDHNAADFFATFANDGLPLLHCGGEPIGSPSTPLYVEYKD